MTKTNITIVVIMTINVVLCAIVISLSVASVRINDLYIEVLERNVKALNKSVSTARKCQSNFNQLNSANNKD